MQPSPFDIKRIANKLEELSSAHHVAMLIRHGAREKIQAASLASAINAPLTEAGREEAREQGAALQRETLHRFYTSPVPRCAETAECLSSSLESNGGLVQNCGAKRFLGAEFVRDEQAFISSIDTQGLREIVAKWASGELADEIITPIVSAGSKLLGSLEATSLENHSTGIDVHVTHDLVVLALLSLTWDVGKHSFPWPGFLDGALVWRGETGYRLWYHGEEGHVPS